MAEIWEFWLPFSIALIGFIILIYDHIKDGRQLTKSVGEFYEAIEYLIFSYHGELLLEKLRGISKDNTKIERLKQERIKVRLKQSYYQKYLKYQAEDHFKYLGLVYSCDNKMKLINKNTNFVLGAEGLLRYKDLKGEPGDIEEIKVIPDFMNITDDQLKMIDEFLASLRQYWRDNHYKWLFQPKIEKDLNFSSEFKKINSIV